MNQIILNLMIINSIATIIYIIYIIYKYKNDNMDKLLESNKEILDQYNKNKRSNITVYIIGILLGLIILVITDCEYIKPSVLPKIVSDVSDIYVK